MHFFGHRGNRYRRIVRQARHLQCASRLFGQSRLWRSGRRSGSTQIHLLCGQRRRLHTCRHHRSDIRDASGMAYRRKRALFAMPCGCDRRLQSATRRDLVIEACVRIISSCGDQSLGETPGPIPNPEAKAWHGDGTAPDRVWESSTPPHHTYRKPLGAHAPRGFPHIRNTHDPNPHTPTKTPGASRMPGHKQDTSGTHTATGPPHTRGTTTDLCCDAWIGPAVLNVLMPFGRWSCQGKRYGNRIATRRLIGARLASR